MTLDMYVLCYETKYCLLVCLLYIVDDVKIKGKYVVRSGFCLVLI